MQGPNNVIVQRPLLISVTCGDVRGEVNASIIAWMRAKPAEEGHPGTLIRLTTGETIQIKEPIDKILALIAGGGGELWH